MALVHPVKPKVSSIPPIFARTEKQQSFNFRLKTLPHGHRTFIFCCWCIECVCTRPPPTIPMWSWNACSVCMKSQEQIFAPLVCQNRKTFSNYRSDDKITLFSAALSAPKNRQGLLQRYRNLTLAHFFCAMPPYNTRLKSQRSLLFIFWTDLQRGKFGLILFQRSR